MRELASRFPGRDELHTVLDIAARAPSLKNLQPWRWHVDDAGVHLYADWSRRAGDAADDRRDVLLGCGAVLDHCASVLAARGWHPRVRRFPDPDDHSHLAILELIEGPTDGAHTELAAAIPGRRADRRRYGADSVEPGTLELMYIRAARMQVRFNVVPRSRWIRLDDGTVRLRYGRVASEDVGPLVDGAVLVALGTDRDDDGMRLRAGEALSRLLLSAAAMNLATCPLTEPLNDIRDRLALACEVFDAEAYPQALIRLGVPVGADPEVPTPRRSVAETTTWALSSGRG